MTGSAIFYGYAQTPGTPFADAPIPDGFVNPHAMPEADRIAALRSVRAGDIVSARIRIHAFGDRPNSHNLRPEPGSMPALARTAKGIPFVEDHRVSTSTAKNGVVLAGDAVEATDGVVDLFADIEIRRQAELVELFERLIEEFSIRLDFESAYCSHCAEEFAVYSYYIDVSCACERGKRRKHPLTGETSRVEIFVRKARLIEISKVPRGAFPGTRIVGAMSADGRRIYTMPDDGHTHDTDTAGENSMPDEDKTPQAPPTPPEPTEAEKRVEALQDRCFKAAFDAAVREFKLPPAALKSQQRIFERLGRDPEAYEATLEPLQPNPIYSQTLGTDAPGAPPASSGAAVFAAGTQKKGDAHVSMDLARIAVETGVVTVAGFTEVFNVDPGVVPDRPLDRLNTRRR